MKAGRGQRGSRSSVRRAGSIVGLILILLLCARGPGVATAQPLPSHQVITAEEIQQAGLLRLGDLLQLVDGWSVASTDGFHERAVPFGAMPGQSSAWRVWVDGHPAHLAALGAPELNRLPVLLQDVRCVEVLPPLAWQASGPASHPVLRIHTRRPDRTQHLRGTYWTGNAAGDPGPYRYLDESSGNIDHLGPDIEITAEGRETDGSISQVWYRAAGLSRIHFPTQPAILPRVRAVTPGRAYPKAQLLALAVQTHVQQGGATHDLWGSFTGMNDYLYLDAYARELPVRSFYAQLGLQGTAPVDRRTTLHYRVAYAINVLDRRPNRLYIDPGWRVDHRAATAALHRHGPVYEISAGLHATHEQAITDTPLRDATYATGAAFVQVRRQTDEGWQPALVLQVRTDGVNTGLEGRLTASRHKGSAALTGALTYVEHFSADDQPLWFWTRRGYRLLDTLDVPYRFAGRLGRSRQLNMDLQGTLRLNAALRVRGTLGYRRFWDVTLEKRTRLVYVAAEQVFAGPVQVSAGFGGQALGAYVSTRCQWAPWLVQHLGGGVQHALAGDAAFHDAWAMRPTWHASGRWHLTPVPAFALGVQLAYQSATYWDAFAGAETLSGGHYAARVPGSWSTTLTATKWLWDQRLRGRLVLRNVFNRSYRTHPIGAEEPLSLRIQVAVQL